MKTISLLVVAFIFVCRHATVDTLDVCLTGCRFNSVAAAIQVSKNGDFIRVAHSTYPETLVVNKNVTLNGGYSGPPAWQRDISVYPIVLDARSTGRVILIPDNFSPTIDGFIITGGKAANGGGVAIISSSPKLLHNIIKNNQATRQGGGVWIIGRTALPLVDGNRIIDNYAFDGGGVFINDFSSPLLTNNVIAKNGALSNGDGIYCDYYCTPRIINNTIVDNNRGDHRTSPEGIFLYNSPSPKIINNIIAKHRGCGIVGAAGPNSVLDYNDVWGNDASYCSVPCGKHDISDDPRFVNSDSNYHVQPNSFVIDKGTSEGAPLVDFDGEHRPLNKGIDIGADENIKTSALDPPEAPSLVSPRNDSTEVATYPTLFWNATSGLGTISYRLQVDIDSCFSSSGVRDQDGIVATKFMLSNLLRNRVYFWRLRASNEGGISGWSEIWEFKTTVVTPPEAPLLVSPDDHVFRIPTNPTLKWLASNRATFYQVQVSKNPSFSPIVRDTSGIQGTQYTIPRQAKLDTNTTYFWQVRAWNLGGTSIWANRRFTTNVNNNQIAEIPTEFALDQNYPNPFNPSTVIRYALPKSAHVKLAIYDLLGAKIRTLVEGVETTGFKQVTWDATNDTGERVPSGVYLYRLEAGEFVVTRKLTVMK